MTPQQKQQVTAALQEIKQLAQLSSGGKGTETVIASIFAKHTKLPIIDTDQFKRDYTEYYTLMGKENQKFEPIFDFSQYRQKPLKSGLKRKDGFIAFQPRGTQSAPDILLVTDYVGLPIEVKASHKNGNILWNSNLPKKGFIYIYNQWASTPKKPAGTTFFMGQDDITQTIYDILRTTRAKLQAIANKSNAAIASAQGQGSQFDMYVRPMHNAKQNYLLDVNTQEREQSVLEYIQSR